MNLFRSATKAAGSSRAPSGTEAALESAQIPPIDRIVPAHPETATFALG